MRVRGKGCGRALTPNGASSASLNQPVRRTDGLGNALLGIAIAAGLGLTATLAAGFGGQGAILGEAALFVRHAFAALARDFTAALGIHRREAAGGGTPGLSIGGGIRHGGLLGLLHRTSTRNLSKRSRQMVSCATGHGPGSK